MHGHEETDRELLNLKEEWAERLLSFFYLLSADHGWAEDEATQTITEAVARGRDPSGKRILQIAFEKAKQPPTSSLNRRDAVAVAVASLEFDSRLIIAAARGLRLGLEEFCVASGATRPSAARQLASAMRELRVALSPVGAHKNGDLP